MLRLRRSCGSRLLRVNSGPVIDKEDVAEFFPEKSVPYYVYYIKSLYGVLLKKNCRSSTIFLYFMGRKVPRNKKQKITKEINA